MQEYQSLGLALTQNLAVYRRHRLHKTFERMQEAEPGTLNHQFELLRQAQAMSTFALKLGPPTGKDYQSGSGGKLGTKAPVTRRAERRREVRAREVRGRLLRVLTFLWAGREGRVRNACLISVSCRNCLGIFY